MRNCGRVDFSTAGCVAAIRCRFSSTIPCVICRLIRRRIEIREDIAMAFFKRELSPVERFESALREKQAVRQKLADRVSIAEAELVRKTRRGRTACGSRRHRCEARSGGDQDARRRGPRQDAARRHWRNSTSRSPRPNAHWPMPRRSATATWRRTRSRRWLAAIERAVPGFGAGAAALVDAVAKSAVSMPEATRFSTSVDAVRREVLAATDLVCWELRSAAVRTRAGNANMASARARTGATATS